MLPDLRIVIAAIISTFILTAGVGFYTSARLMSEPNKHADSLAAREESPVSRIALSWPAPSRQPEQPALDFAVTAKALRNPVRDVTHETQQDQWPATAQEKAAERISEAALAAPRTDSPTTAERAAPPASDVAAPPPESGPVADVVPPPAPQPDIRIAVQYPPLLELPPELRIPVADAAAPEPATASQPPQEAPVTTGSIAETPAKPEAAAPEEKKPDAQVASRPEAAAENYPRVLLPELPKPAPKPARSKAGPKKAAPAKVAKRPARTVRRRPVATIPRATWPFNFFGNQVAN